MAENQPNVAEYLRGTGDKASTLKSPKEMFQDMEKAFRRCVFCSHNQEPSEEHPETQILTRCSRCLYVYYCSKECQDADWSKHSNFCKDLRLAAVDNIVEWLIFKGELPFPTEKWSKPPSEVKRWEDWLAMQVNLPAHLNAIMSGAYMKTLWSDAGRPQPDKETLEQSVWRVCSEFFSRPLTIAWAMRMFNLNPYDKPLTIHLVGVVLGPTTMGKLTDYDELNNMFPEHQGIEVVLVGPELGEGPFMRAPLGAFGPMNSVFVSAYSGLYHRFWENLVEQGEAARPDLVIGLHPGFDATRGLDDAWLSTLLLLRDYGISSFFTARNEVELASALRIITQLDIDMRGRGNNPFFSLKYDVLSFHEPIVHANRHYFCFQGPLWKDELEELEGA